jgi:hypothetical protein
MSSANDNKAGRVANVPLRFLGALTLSVFAITAGFGVMSARHLFHRGADNQAATVSAAPDMSPFFLEQRASRLSESEATRRVVYPYSVIPGGVQSTMELTSAVMHDPVVAGHYSDFDISRAKLVRLDHDELVHVSYRMNNMIYWTKRTYLLHKGEMLVSDGKHQARTRCGNRVSQNPTGNTSKNEPGPTALEVPQDPAPFHAMDLPMMFAMEPPPSTDIAIPSGGATPPGGVFFIPPVIMIPGAAGPKPSTASGPTGSTGSSGPTGSTGPSGPTGGSGPTGSTGPSGPTGGSGPTGSTGPSGPTGGSGPTGSTGPSGPTGGSGPTGSTGPSGPTGGSGPTGSTGPSGPTGGSGPTGSTGGGAPPPPPPPPPPTPTPEPGSLLLVGTGIAAVLKLRKKAAK